MSHDSRVLEQLEAFRPGVDDLATEPWQDLRAALESDVELQRRLARVEVGDRAIRKAMQDAPVPAGLADRLLAAVQAQAAANTDFGAGADGSKTKVELPPPASSLPPRKLGRRSALVLGAMATLAAAAAVVVVLQRPQASTEEVSREQLNAYVQAWLSDPGLRSAEGWNDELGVSYAKTHPVDSAVFAATVRWRRIVPKSGPPAVIYRLTRQGKTADLFVVRTSQPYEQVPGSPMLRWKLTGAKAAGAWQRNGQLYVLIVNENDASIEDFVRRPQVA